MSEKTVSEYKIVEVVSEVGRSLEEAQLSKLSRVLKALSHPNTLRIVLLLKQQGPLSVQQLHTQLAIDQSATSARLTKLADLGVVIRQGRHALTRYELVDPTAITVGVLLAMGQDIRMISPVSRQNCRLAGCAGMTKQDVIERICQRTGQDPLVSRAVLEAFFGVVKQELSAGESVYVRGFGSFVPAQRAAKVARNITQNTSHTIEAHILPVFKPSAEFKQQVRARPVDTK